MIDALQELHDEAIKREYTSADALAAVPGPDRASAANLVHYLAIRQHDIRDLQFDLHTMGLNSLGRMEAYVLPTLEAVLRALYKLSDHSTASSAERPASFGFREGRARLADNTAALLGPPPQGRDVRIMVTMPSAAAERYELIRDLLRSGMNVMRINCSKDSPDRWSQMIENLRRAEREIGNQCRVQMDLAGPNPRTGPLQRKARVVHWRPSFDSAGRLVQRALIWLTCQGAEAKAATEVLPVNDALLQEIDVGDQILVLDTRVRRQMLHVANREEHGCWAEADDEAFVEQGTDLNVIRNGKWVARGQVAEVPRDAIEQEFYIGVEDHLVLTRTDIPGQPPRRDANGNLVEPARVGCTLPEIFRDVREGERFFYDDGELGGVVREVSADEVLVEVTHARKGSAKIKSDKSMNFPDTDFDLPALTEKDLRDLDFAVDHADLVGISFVRQVSDVESLIRELDRRDAKTTGVVLKIETQSAFQNLPELLLGAMQHPPVGVMVARGDMGVELGFSRMSEVQEEILWLCEAAHVPVIWATQVLESLAKKGLPTRAVVTDTAMSSRAECVMLDKGEHIVETVQLLCDILQRMRQHQRKKIATLRKLDVSDARLASLRAVASNSLKSIPPHSD